MSSPSSFKMDTPTPVPGPTRRRHFVLYVIMIWLSALPAVLFEYYIYWNYLYVQLPAVWAGWMWFFWILMPVNILFVLYLTELAAILLARFFLLFVRRPQEGVYPRDPKSKEYRAWGLRNLIRKWPFWIISSLPFPWFRGKFILTTLGLKVKIGKGCSLTDGFVTPELVELGNSVVLGQSSVITSYHFEGDLFILRKVTIGDDAIIGSRVTILPGTQIGNNATISGESYTLYHTRVEPYSIYRGKPAKKIGSLPQPK